MKVMGLLIIVALVGVGVAATFLVVNRQSAEPTATPVVVESGTPNAGSGQFIQNVPDDFAMPPEDEMMEDNMPPEPGDEIMAEDLAPSGEEVTVAIDDTGFIPQTVSIAVGTTVVFVNNGQALHWPASDTHPTHEILPAFDAKHGLQTGEKYSYTFGQVGDWPCHDHLMPAYTCLIKVTSE